MQSTHLFYPFLKPFHKCESKLKAAKSPWTCSNLAKKNTFPGSDRDLSNWKPTISDSNNIRLTNLMKYENTLKCLETPWISALNPVPPLQTSASSLQWPLGQGGPPHRQYVAEVVHIASLLHAVALQDLRSWAGKCHDEQWLRDTPSMGVPPSMGIPQ